MQNQKQSVQGYCVSTMGLESTQLACQVQLKRAQVEEGMSQEFSI